MRQGTVLRVVEDPPAFREEIDLSEEGEGASHSLHYLVQYLGQTPPELASFAISRYSQPGDYVLDPFCGGGTIGLQAGLQGRQVLMSDYNPLLLKVARAKLQPADITEVTLKLQEVNLSAPISTDPFSEYFAPFFDIRTYCELANLKRFLSSKPTDLVANYVQAIAMSLLHGQGAGVFSVATHPQLALSPMEQEQLNDERAQLPEYRAVLPRILRKTATAQRDGIPSVLHEAGRNAEIRHAAANDLSFIRSGQARLVVTTPPSPLKVSAKQNQANWLRGWLTGLPVEQSQPAPAFREGSLTSWLDFMNQVLFELARVVEPTGRVVLNLTKVKLGGAVFALDDELVDLVEEDLSRYWEVEGLYVDRRKGEVLKHSLRARADSKRAKERRILVLKRR